MSTKETATNKAPLERELYKKIEQWLGIIPSVIWYERLNSGNIQTSWGTWVKLCRKGTPDYVALVHGSGTAHIIFIEAKRKGKKQTQEQAWFQEKVSGIGNIHYLLIEEVLPLIDKINELSFFGVSREEVVA